MRLLHRPDFFITILKFLNKSQEVLDIKTNSDILQWELTPKTKSSKSGTKLKGAVFF